MGIRPCLIGNWKMNGLVASLGQADAIAAGLTGHGGHVDVMLCPPATLIAPMVLRLAGTRVAVGGQDCHPVATGAFTGDVSAEMLTDAGATAVILGHSERRALHGERDQDVKAKALAARRAGLIAIVCVGETIGQRNAGLTEVVVRRQLAGSLPEGATAANTIVAYEPVWAIGSGLTPSTTDVATIHRAIRAALVARFGAEGANMRILYGGSVKPSNAAELMAVPDVNGALVGGASLMAADFLGILAGFPSAPAG
jgi:triosephosphate isomerase